MEFLCHFTNIEAYIHIKDNYPSATLVPNGEGIKIMASKEDVEKYEDAWLSYMLENNQELELIYY